MDTQTSSSDTSGQITENEELYLASSKFESYDELLKSLRAFYGTKGYGLSIRDSRKDKYVTLQCDRGGSYRDIRSPGINRKKKSNGSRLINCPFRIVGIKRSHGNWVLKAKNLTHNHEPSTNFSKLPSFRRLPPDHIQSVKDMTLSGIPPREILSSLRQQIPNLPATSRTIYNLKAKFRKDNFGNRSMVTALFEELEKGGFLYDILYNLKGQMTNLFVVHPLSIRLAKVFPNIFVMDCTCKTSKYKMPFLNIIGISCFNTSFYSGFAFLEKEDEESYIWALSAFKRILGLGIYPFVIMIDRELALLNAINKVFPNATSLFCVWHIQKDMLANCKKYFGHDDEFDIFMSSWNNVVYSTTEALFEKNWGEFELYYEDKKDAIEYIKNIWLPCKEKFVSAWTEKHLHFGNRQSSRAEGAHAKLKQYLQVSTGGFREVKEKICIAVEHEFNEIKRKLASEKLQVPDNCNLPIFRELMPYVSQFALNEIHTQYKKIKDGTMTPCTGHFMATMGLPCVHKIENWDETTLSLELIHPHWRTDKLSLDSEDGAHGDDSKEFAKLLNELHSKYQIWPPNRKEFAILMICKLVNQSD